MCTCKGPPAALQLAVSRGNGTCVGLYLSVSVGVDCLMKEAECDLLQAGPGQADDTGLPTGSHTSTGIPAGIRERHRRRHAPDQSAQRHHSAVKPPFLREIARRRREWSTWRAERRSVNM